VPARFLMVVTFGLTVLAGLGAAALAARRSRAATIALVVLCAIVLVEGWVGPLRMSVRSHPVGYNPPPRHLPAGPGAEAIHRFIAAIDEPVVLIALPIGDAWYDTRHTFEAGLHRRPLVNGFSGFSPAWYPALAGRLGGSPSGPAAAAALDASGATHVLVHEYAYRGGGRDVSSWLASLGAQPLAAEAGVRLFRLPR